MNIENLKSNLNLSKEWISKQIEFFLTDKGLQIISLLPVFFSWLPVLIYKFENIEIKKKCILSLTLTLFFLSALILSYFISFLPFIGGLIANMIHFLAVFGYLAISIFLVYSEYKDKKVELRLLAKYSESLEKFLL